MLNYEIGFHINHSFWGQGYGPEAAVAVIDCAFEKLGATSLVAGHHSQNIASKKVLERLGFHNVGDQYYPPTNLNHPRYQLEPLAKS